MKDRRANLSKIDLPDLVDLDCPNLDSIEMNCQFSLSNFISTPLTFSLDDLNIEQFELGPAEDFELTPAEHFELSPAEDFTFFDVHLDWASFETQSVSGNGDR
ncbi:hypothetical protein BH10CYA1_BH10CYA1_58500 [soil metagenome]